MSKKKPLGITLITLYNAVFAVMFLPVGCMATVATGIPEMPQYTGLIGLFYLGFGLLLAATVYGLWTLQDWGRVVTIWLNIVCLPMAVLAIFGLFPYAKVSLGNTVFNLIYIALAIWMIKYLRSEDIHILFDDDYDALLNGRYERQEPL